LLQFRTDILEALRGDSDTDVDSLDRSCGRFFGVSGRMEFGAEPDRVVARVGALSELDQRRVHSANIAIGW
jgi:hypothetical protein